MAVYLIHFRDPFGHAEHYLGFADGERNLRARLDHHRQGGSHAANLMRHVKLAGIPWKVSRVWPEGDRTYERTLKNMGSRKRLCPDCGGTWGVKLPSLTGAELQNFLLRG